MAYETFARRLTTLLTSTLRQVCQVTIREITQQSYDEYIGQPRDRRPCSCPSTCCPLGTGCPGGLAADRAGGDRPHARRPRRHAAVAHAHRHRDQPRARLIDQILSVLRYALEPVVAVELEVGPIEYNPQFLQIASAADAVVVGEFELSIGRGDVPR